MVTSSSSATVSSPTAASSPELKMGKPVVVFVLGLPGAGKGTQCAHIQKHFGFMHVSAGDCLREERSRPGSTLGEEIERHMVNGTIVPVEVTCALLRQKMREHGWDNGKFLIDGFPRNHDNWNGWLKACADDTEVAFCLDLKTTEDVVMERIRERSKTSQRCDDTDETVRKRFAGFRSETAPVIELFKKMGKYVEIDATASIDDVWSQVQKAFTSFTDNLQKIREAGGEPTFETSTSAAAAATTTQ